MLGYIAYAGYELLNCFDFQMCSKYRNREKYIYIYCICTLDRRNCTLYSRKRILGRGKVSEGYPQVKLIMLAGTL